MRTYNIRKLQNDDDMRPVERSIQMLAVFPNHVATTPQTSMFNSPLCTHTEAIWL